MLILTAKPTETLLIGDSVRIRVSRRCVIEIDAPRDVVVRRVKESEKEIDKTIEMKFKE